MRHSPFLELGYVLAFLVLVSAIYVGTYYATVDPEVILTAGDDPDYTRGSMNLVFVKRPRYPFASETLEVIFRPIHAVDVRLRPDTWKPNP